MSTGPDPKFKAGQRVRRTRRHDWTGVVLELEYEPAAETLHGRTAAAWYAVVHWDFPNERRCPRWSVQLLELAP